MQQMRPWGSAFFDHVGRHVNAFMGLPQHIHRAVVEAYIKGAMVNDIEGIERIRFMTSHPKDLSQKLIETMAKCEHVCEYLHLPVQAGSNDILKK